MRRGVPVVGAAVALTVLWSVWQKGHRSEHTFVCNDGTTVGATFSNDSVKLRLPDGDATLPIARSASGARYANDTLEFWEHAGEARISRHGAMLLEGCRPGK